MNQSGFVEILDAKADPDISHLGAVAGLPNIRCYAARPLISNEGAPFGALCVSDFAQRTKGLNAFQRDGRSFQREFRIRHKDGEYRWEIFRVIPVFTSTGESQNWYGTATDIDDRYRISEEREWLSGELTHRIKNIFAVITGLISVPTERLAR